MMFLVMPNPETGVVGQIHILVDFRNVLEMNVPLSLTSNNSMKMAKNQTSFTAYQEAVKVSQIFKIFVLLLSDSIWVNSVDLLVAKNLYNLTANDFKYD